MPISVIDIVILIPVIYGCYQGFTKGFIISVATLVGLFLGVWGGVKFSDYTASFLWEKWNIDIPLLAFAVTFIIILISVYLIGKLIEKFVDALSLGIFNKIGGLIAGGGKAIVILAVITLFFEGINKSFSLINPNQLSDSILYPQLKIAGDKIAPIISNAQKYGVDVNELNPTE